MVEMARIKAGLKPDIEMLKTKMTVKTFWKMPLFDKMDASFRCTGSAGVGMLIGAVITKNAPMADVAIRTLCTASLFLGVDITIMAAHTMRGAYLDWKMSRKQTMG